MIQLPLTDFLARLVSADGKHYVYVAEPSAIEPYTSLLISKMQARFYIQLIPPLDSADKSKPEKRGENSLRLLKTSLISRVFGLAGSVFLQF